MPAEPNKHEEAALTRATEGLEIGHGRSLHDHRRHEIQRHGLRRPSQRRLARARRDRRRRGSRGPSSPGSGRKRRTCSPRPAPSRRVWRQPRRASRSSIASSRRCASRLIPTSSRVSAIAASSRNGCTRPCRPRATDKTSLTLVIFDLDHFKKSRTTPRAIWSATRCCAMSAGRRRARSATATRRCAMAARSSR